jgi:hypothetical protein
MSSPFEAVRSGFYAQTQVNTRSQLISWSPRVRLAHGIVDLEPGLRLLTERFSTSHFTPISHRPIGR